MASSTPVTVVRSTLETRAASKERAAAIGCQGMSPLGRILEEGPVGAAIRSDHGPTIPKIALPRG